MVTETNMCCANRKDFYPLPPIWIDSLSKLLEQVGERETINGSIFVTRHLCRSCGQSWEVKEVNMGHRDWDYSTYKIPVVT